MAEKTEYVEIDAECIHETEEALLVLIEGEKYWVPKSLLHPEDNEVASKGDTGVLCVPKWFSDKEGLEGDI